MVRLVIFLILLGLVWTAAYENRDQEVALRYFFGISTPPIPLHLLLPGAILGGLLLAVLFLLPGWIRMALEVRRQARTIERLEEDLQRSLSGTADRPPASPPERERFFP